MKFIFSVKIKDGYSEKDYVNAWRKGSAIIQRTVGAQGTVLYRALDIPNTFLAIATWESKKARDSAMQKLRNADGGTEAILKRHKEFAEVQILGNFEEISQVIESPE